jgi:hypothetical protein
MLFMVIERFKSGAVKAVGERFKLKGRMVPEGVTDNASWMDSTGTRCFQIMETERPELLKTWIACWDDLVDFEIIPVMTSVDFWAKTNVE